jgi:hypothetical protein
MFMTFLIEIVMAAYILWRYGFNKITQLATLILVNLAVFQLAEFMVCEGALGLDSLQWARIGYVAITLLPPLGIHLGLRLSGVSNRALLAVAYGSAAAFAAVFLFVGHGMQSQVCLGNYVIFSIAPWAVWPYAIYYYGWLLAGSWMAYKYAETAKKKNIKNALHGLTVGYAAFILPTTVVNIIDPSTISGIPSIMCGFAVLLAFCLTFWVIPAYADDRNTGLAFLYRR